LTKDLPQLDTFCSTKVEDLLGLKPRMKHRGTLGRAVTLNLLMVNEHHRWLSFQIVAQSQQ